MELPTEILLHYGYLLIFGWVLLEQMGAPLPAMPVLMAAGALAAEGTMNPAGAFAVALVACLLADTAWFLIGRRWGHVVLHLLCRLSLEPTTCVRRTQNSFGRRHGAMLIFAKFVPGLATVAPPVAGENGMSTASFLLYDTAGSVLWIGALLAAGSAFAGALNQRVAVIAWVGRFSGALLAVGIAAFLVARLVRWAMAASEMGAARIEPEELKLRIDRGEAPLIVDLRHGLETVSDPVTLPGALQIAPEALAERVGEIPRDREVVLFCACPSEATAAKTAMQLQKLGLEHVRPLRGGIDRWREQGFPLERVTGAPSAE